MTNTECNCLRAEDPTLPHAARCAVYGGQHPTDADHGDIRELAELAANSDIDTALYILRKHRAGTAR